LNGLNPAVDGIGKLGQYDDVFGGFIVLAQILLIAQAVAALTGGQPSQDDVDLYTEDHKAEAKRLAGTNGQVVRSADTLTVSWQGKPVATLSDVRPYDCMHAVQPCAIWSFASVLMLRPKPDAPVEPYPAFIYSPGIGGKMAIVDHDGSLVWMDFMTSEKGRFIASGSLWEMHTPPHFLILDWTSDRHSTAWSSNKPCEPIKWISEYDVEAVCDLPNQTLSVVGTVRPKYNGDWSFIPIGWMTRQSVMMIRTGRGYRIIRNKTPLPPEFVLKTVDYGSLSSSRPGSSSGEDVLGYRKLD